MSDFVSRGLKQMEDVVLVWFVLGSPKRLSFDVHVLWSREFIFGSPFVLFTWGSLV